MDKPEITAAFARVDDKLEDIRSSLNSIDVTLAKQEVQLAEHIRRTGLLEDFVKAHTVGQDKDLDAIHRHITKVQFFGWLLVVVVPILIGVYAQLK